MPLRNDGPRGERERGIRKARKERIPGFSQKGAERFLRVNGDERNGCERGQVEQVFIDRISKLYLDAIINLFRNFMKEKIKKLYIILK